MGTLSGVQLHLVNTFDQAVAFKSWLGERRPNDAICVDTETSGLDPYAPGAQIRLIQIGDGMNGWAIPWEDWKGLAVEALEQWQGDVVGHNLASFDLRWIEQHSKYRFRQHKVRDTMLAAHIIDPLGPGGLKPLSRKLIDARAMAGEKRLHEGMVDNKWTWATVPVDFAPYWQYGALDTVLGWRIDELFTKQVGDGQRYASIFDLEMAARFVCTRMEQRGARIDLDYCKQMGQKLFDHAEVIKKWGKDNFGILLSSGPQLAKWFQAQGEEITVFSEKTGAPSVDKWQLNIFTNSSNPTVAMVAEQTLLMRKNAKIAATYFGNLVDTARDYEGNDYVHANIRTLGARTGRMSISDPPLQQLPKTSALVRRAFIAREGCKLISTDYSQIEMREMAHFSEDAGLIEAFVTADATGGDFFVEMGKSIYREPDFQKKDKRRGLVKNTMYGSAYGAGTAKMAESAGVRVDEMEPVVRQIAATFPGLKRFQKQTERLARDREYNEGQGYVVTPFGRRLPCDEGKAYTLVNYMLQGHAAEIFKKALVELDAAGWGEYMLLPVHDEIVVDVPEELAHDAMVEIPKVMENTTDYRLPFYADSEGPFDNWGQKYE